MKRNLQLKWMLETMLVTSLLLLFVFLLFTAMDNTQAAISGEQLTFYSHPQGFVVDLYGRGYLVDFTPLEQLGSQINQYWEWIPRPLRAVQGVVETIGEIARSL
ncbi:MAG: hypothetical protein UGF45_03290 [Massilioclostridium sp.]|nr:hypothetical protein [Massilioclostridium sp.]MEE1491055.1 hypothetical protein [Massilioclostridium sp.]